MKKYIYNPLIIIIVTAIFFAIGIIFNSPDAVSFSTSNLIGKISFIMTCAGVAWVTIGIVLLNIIRKNKKKE